MNRISLYRIGFVLVAMLMIALPSAIFAFELRSNFSVQSGEHTKFLPLIATGNKVTQPQQPPAASLPAEIAATWFSGVIPPTDFYNPTTGEWRDTNGLGQMYVFNADASYVYAGFLRIQNGACRTEVSTYQQGTAKASATTLTLTPTVAKTRTVIVCGSQSETTTNGPFEPYAIGWRVADDGLGHPKLFAQKAGQTTEYYRKGMLTALVGGWNLNGVASNNFYNPQTGAWASPANDGAWFRFAADGTYRFGEYGHGQDEQGCDTIYWVYQTGNVKVSGGQLSYQATGGRARVEHLCGTGQVEDESYIDPTLYEFTWELRDQSSAPKLAISPLGKFQYFVFERE